MQFPLELAEISQADNASPGHLYGSAAVKCSRYTVCVVVLPKSLQLLRKISGVSEEHLIKKLTTDGPDKPFDEAMR